MRLDELPGLHRDLCELGLATLQAGETETKSTAVGAILCESGERGIGELSLGSMDAVVTIGDDVGTQRGMMMSRSLWRKVISPYLRKLIAVFHDLGVKVMYHSCGSIIPIIDDLIGNGVDILEPIQTGAEGMDAGALKEKFGKRLSFHGGVDEQDLLPHGSPQCIRQEVERLGKTLGRDGGYILMAAHAFQPDIPCENVVAMYEAAEASYDE